MAVGAQLFQHRRTLFLAAKRPRNALVDISLEEIALERAFDDAAVKGELEKLPRTTTLARADFMNHFSHRFGKRQEPLPANLRL